MDEERAGSGSRDNRSAPTRALLGSYPYQTHTRRDLAITRAARVVLGAFWRRGFSRCSYSSRRGIRVPTYSEYQSDRESALRQGNPRSNRQGSVLRDRSKIRVGGCCAQPKTQLHLDMRQSTRQKGTSYPGLEIIAKLATVLEVEPAELIRLPARQLPPSL